MDLEHNKKGSNGSEKSELVTVAIHQLKTALTTNKWAINYLFGENNDNLTPAQREVLETVYESNERAIKIVKGILLTEKEIGGVFKLNLSKINLNKLISKIIKRLEPEIRKKSLKMSVEETSQNFPEIIADEEKINYVFENIIGDAVLYTADGGSVSVKIEEKPQNKIEVSVTDTGIGIPEEDKKDVFKKFFRGKNAKEADMGGTGLGLFISKYIVEKHGGDIDFDSTEGLGTVFKIILPIDKNL